VLLCELSLKIVVQSQVEGLVSKVDRNIAADGPGAGPIDSVLSQITKKISSIDSKIDGGAGGAADAGPDASGMPVMSLLSNLKGILLG